MSQGAVAARYAQALLELGSEVGQLEAFASSFRTFASAYERSRELRWVGSDPTIARDERERALLAVAQKLAVPDLVQKAILLMARRRRLAAVPEVAKQLTELADARAGVLRASVTTAQQMPEAYYESLAAGIGHATGKRVVLSREIDRTLIGGAVAHIGDVAVDVSIRGRLDKIQRELLQASATSI